MANGLKNAGALAVPGADEFGPPAGPYLFERDPRIRRRR